MSSFKSKISNYLEETLGQKIEPTQWVSSRRLPLFLRTDYSHYTISLEGTQFLVVFDQDSERSAATIQKHFAKIREKWDGEVIYSRLNISSLDRKRLIERKIPFIIPGNQMYLPMLGIDLREYFRQHHDDVDKFSPATTATLLLLLNEAPVREYEASDLAERLDYSKMTMSRSLNELLNSDLGVVTVEGRTRKLKFMGSLKRLWDESQKYLETPIKQTLRVRSNKKPIGVVGGLNALSRYSSLASPIADSVATTASIWKDFCETAAPTEAKIGDPEHYAVEVWNYDPRLFAKDGIADQFSIYLSLANSPDERVEIAMEEMMETCLLYTSPSPRD